MVANDLSRPYVEARSTEWLKVKVHQGAEFVICGYTKLEGARQHFGVLLLGAYGDDKLHNVGKVGSGFDESTLAALYQKVQPLVRSQAALVDPPRRRAVVFIAARLVAQIPFREWTAGKKLRQPVFLSLREGKSAQDVLLPGSAL